MILRRCGLALGSKRCFGVVQDLAKRTLLENAVNFSNGEGSMFGRAASQPLEGIREDSIVDSARWKSIVVSAAALLVLLPLAAARPAPLVHAHLSPHPSPMHAPLRPGAHCPPPPAGLTRGVRGQPAARGAVPAQRPRP